MMEKQKPKTPLILPNRICDIYHLSGKYCLDFGVKKEMINSAKDSFEKLAPFPVIEV